MLQDVLRAVGADDPELCGVASEKRLWRDRKSTRLNSSHSQISYAVFCLKKKKQTTPSLVRDLIVLFPWTRFFPEPTASKVRTSVCAICEQSRVIKRRGALHSICKRSTRL